MAIYAKLLLTAIIGTMTLQAQGHMLLYKPTPFNPESVDNSPLVGPGAGTSNYPCKIYNGLSYDFSFPRTQIPAGSSYTVQFKGQSVHGGGSCQFSLSKDLQPTAQSEFKVIHSIQGGCPARNTPGNLGADTSAVALDPFSYNFTMPADIPPGDYTFAWTWFNKVGNREMYMQCAPITVPGSKKMVHRRGPAARRAAKRSLSALPNMFLANIPDVQCASPDEGNTADMTFPDPGSSIEDNVPSSLRSPPKGDVSHCYAPVGAAVAPAPSGGGGGGGSTAAPSAPAPSAPAPSAPAPAPSAPPSQAPSAPPAPAPTGGSGGGSGACSSGRVPCPSPGSVICVGASQFGLCDIDNCAIPQALAAGTSCSGGVIS